MISNAFLIFPSAYTVVPVVHSHDVMRAYGKNTSTAAATVIGYILLIFELPSLSSVFKNNLHLRFPFKMSVLQKHKDIQDIIH